MPDIQIRQAGFLLIALLRLNDEAVHVIGRAPDFERETVLFMFRKVIQMHVHQFCELHEFLIELGFVV